MRNTQLQHLGEAQWCSSSRSVWRGMAVFMTSIAGSPQTVKFFAGGTTMPDHPTLRTNLQELTLAIPSYSNPADSQVGRWDDPATAHPPALRINLRHCEWCLPKWLPFAGDRPFHASQLCLFQNNSQLTVAWLLFYGITALRNICTVRHTFCSIKSCAATQGTVFWGQCGADIVL